MNYFDYSYKHDYIEFSSTIYKVGTYHYNWHGETEILILLKGRVEMSCNNEVFTMEPLDAVIISPQVGHSVLALEEDVIALVVHVGNEFYQQYDPNFGTYQFVVRSDESTRHNQFFTTLRHHAAMMMLIKIKGESPVHRMWVEHHYLALAGDVYREFDSIKCIHENARPGDIKPATFDKMISYIDEHYQQKIELEEIAKIGGYNVAYTSQFFKRQMGISFVEYVLRLRLRDATTRLTTTDEAIARIASSCGFADIKAFNVAFKKHFNLTPTEYRKQVKALGRKTILQDGKEIMAVDNQAILDLLHSFLSYEDDSRSKAELEFMSQKLESLKAKLADVVNEL
ncbi:helix-turn-helix domain-containing protein [Veillonella sp.]|uniref:helix-turn-helix transcriptional regulator n=1 Tax=Veillonella sp. TaxID=1926307 RepID=UPI00351FF3E0